VAAAVNAPAASANQAPHSKPRATRNLCLVMAVTLEACATAVNKGREDGL
jgi:hypothetical protein